MRQVATYAVFLSATPLHNRNEDLFSLLNLLDPDMFTVEAKATSSTPPNVAFESVIVQPNTATFE